MEALIELCDLIAENPVQFEDKLSWICSRCPQPDSFAAGSPRLSHSQLNATLAVARFLSKSDSAFDHSPKSAILDFLRLIPSSFSRSFWPRSFKNDSIASFYTDFWGYLCKATELCSEFATEVAELMGDIVISAISSSGEEATITRLLLLSLSQNFPLVLPSDADNLVNCLLDQYAVPDVVPASPREQMHTVSDTSSSQSSPLSVVANHNIRNGVSSPRETSQVSTRSPTGASSRLVDDSASSSRVSLGTNGEINSGLNEGGGGRPQASSFEEESMETLEKQEIAYKIITHILDKVRFDPKLLEQVRLMARKQVQSMPAFLKIRKREWNDQGSLLKARINAKLSFYQAAARLKIKSLASLDSDGKSSKKLWLETLVLFTEAAEACLLSVWRKMRMCEDLFSSLVAGMTQIAVTKGGQPLRVFLIRLKLLVLTACAQADTWASSPGSMVESVMRTSCEVIEFGWSKDRTPVDTFIMGLAASIRERNDYDEQVEKEKQQVPVVQLNLIRFLADLSVAVNKSEVVDMILPLFIESLEEGDASTPGSFRLRLLDAISHMASLGFEKSYRETVVLMTRSYLNKLSTLGSAESKTLPAEVTTERVETLPAGFLLIASRLKSSKLRSDFRHRLLSLCSDVGLAAESKSGSSGADYLGPLLLSVAEICSDFDPTVDVEPSLLKLFRNLWFYVALFGLAPPIQSTQIAAKPVSSALNSVGSINTIPLQAVGGPYMWNMQWSSAVKRIAQGTPPLVVSSVKWLEDELELNALHNPGSRRGNGNEKAALNQRAALSAALGGRVEVGGMGTISG